MQGFKVILAEGIEQALSGITRQYLVGNLARPQQLVHVADKRLEIGITRYEEDRAEAPHSHSVATEYQYMLSGETEYLNVTSGEALTFKEGDFFVISPGTVYAQKATAGTAILFVKVPAIDDKIPFSQDDE